MRREVMGRVAVGGEYLFTRARCRFRYRVLGFALCGRTAQWQVVYEGLEGPDLGLWFTCPSYDFAVKFEPVETPSAPPSLERPVPAPECSGKGVLDMPVESAVRQELARIGQRFEAGQKRRRLADLCAETQAEYDAECEAAAAEFWAAGDALADLLLLLLRYAREHRPAQLAAALAAAGLTADVRAVAEAQAALESRVKALEAGKQ